MASPSQTSATSEYLAQQNIQSMEYHVEEKLIVRVLTHTRCFLPQDKKKCLTVICEYSNNRYIICTARQPIQLNVAAPGRVYHTALSWLEAVAFCVLNAAPKKRLPCSNADIFCLLIYIHIYIYIYIYTPRERERERFFQAQTKF
jgi:hypothetical protein